MRYKDQDIVREGTQVPYFKTKVYPPVPLSETDIYIISSIGDRLDIYADTYYKDSTLWWMILMCNPDLDQGSLYPPPGTQIRIAIDVAAIRDLYNKANKLR